jgi:2-oxoglutarate ferredoxin oxidoreductase subunit beta
MSQANLHMVRETYLREKPVFPFCKGCGHTLVLRKLDEALDALQIPPRDVALVTDIGCIGLADALFATIHTVHTTHGRSTAFATGIALADSVLAERRLKIIVLIGDGGAMIGLQHLVHAAMLNVDVTVLVCNNFVYGMTGGQGSSLTPEGLITATTPNGNVVPPIDLCGILKNSHAPFVARALATDRSLTETIREAIATPNFALIEILELCTEYASRRNRLGSSDLRDLAEQNGWQLGQIVKRTDRKPYFSRMVPTNGQERRWEGRRIEAIQPPTHALRKTLGVVVAGSAGERVQSSAAVFSEVALGKGYSVTQKNDNPVTQGTGFSLSEVKIGPEPILYTGIEHPDVLAILSADGWREAVAAGWMERLGSDSEVFLDEDIPVDFNGAHLKRFPLRRMFGAEWTAMGLLTMLGVKYRIASFVDLLQATRVAFGDRAADAVKTGYDELKKNEAVS